MQDKPLRVAYIMSRFPKLTETFILYEMLALRDQDVDLEIHPLLRARNSSTHPEGAGMLRKIRELFRKPDAAAVMHPEVDEMMPAGPHEIAIDVSVYPAGAYFVRIQTEDQRATSTIIKAR